MQFLSTLLLYLRIEAEKHVDGRKNNITTTTKSLPANKRFFPPHSIFLIAPTQQFSSVQILRESLSHFPQRHRNACGKFWRFDCVCHVGMTYKCPLRLSSVFDFDKTLWCKTVFYCRNKKLIRKREKCRLQVLHFHHRSMYPHWFV